MINEIKAEADAKKSERFQVEMFPPIKAKKTKLVDISPGSKDAKKVIKQLEKKFAEKKKKSKTFMKNVKLLSEPKAFVKNKLFDGAKLSRLMIDARWNNDNESILDAATKTGISKSGWQQIEANGMCKPDVLGKICNYLKVPVQFFYS